MKSVRSYIWPAIGLAAVVFSAFLLYREIQGISFEEIGDSLYAIPAQRWVLAIGATLAAYAALAWYDRIALLHLGRRISWPFIALCSFTTYALSHNIGASVLSGAVVRYRAYSTQGLVAAEIGILVALCSLTFALGSIMLGGFVLLVHPELPQRFFDIPPWVSILAGVVMLALVALYVVGSWLQLRPLTVAGFRIYYPRLKVVLRQLFAAPLEILGAAAIIFFALPAHSNPGFIVVLGIFLASFSVALISHAPGGLGVLEFVFLTAMPDSQTAEVLAALIVFRLFYLLIPLAIALVVVVLFERSQLSAPLSEAPPGGEGR